MFLFCFFSGLSFLKKEGLEASVLCGFLWRALTKTSAVLRNQPRQGLSNEASEEGQAQQNGFEDDVAIAVVGASAMDSC